MATDIDFGELRSLCQKRDYASVRAWLASYAGTQHLAVLHYAASVVGLENLKVSWHVDKHTAYTSLSVVDAVYRTRGDVWAPTLLSTDVGPHRIWLKTFEEIPSELDDAHIQHLRASYARLDNILNNLPPHPWRKDAVEKARQAWHALVADRTVVNYRNVASACKYATTTVPGVNAGGWSVGLTSRLLADVAHNGIEYVWYAHYLQAELNRGGDDTYACRTRSCARSAALESRILENTSVDWALVEKANTHLRLYGVWLWPS